MGPMLSTSIAAVTVPGQAPAAHPVHALPGRSRRRPSAAVGSTAGPGDGPGGATAGGAATTTAATTSSTSCPQNRARQPRYWITGEPSVTPRTGSSGADQGPPPQRLDPLLAVEQLQDERHRGGPGGGALHTIEGARDEEHAHVGRGGREHGAHHGPAQPEQVEAAMAEEVAGLAEERRGDAEGQQRARSRPRSGPRSWCGTPSRTVGSATTKTVKVMLSESSPGQQRGERPPAVAGTALGPLGHALAQQDGPARDRPRPRRRWRPTPHRRGRPWGRGGDPGARSRAGSPPTGPYRGARACELRRGVTRRTPQRNAQRKRRDHQLRIAPVGVEVVGDLAHDPIDRPAAVAEAGVGHPGQLRQHVRHIVVGRHRPMMLPDHHRDVADLAVGHPAHVVLVVPRRDVRRLTEVARGVEGKGHAGDCPFSGPGSCTDEPVGTVVPVAGTGAGHGPVGVALHARHHQTRRPAASWWPATRCRRGRWAPSWSAARSTRSPSPSTRRAPRCRWAG